MPNKVWDEITYPFPHFNGATSGYLSIIGEKTSVITENLCLSKKNLDILYTMHKIFR